MSNNEQLISLIIQIAKTDIKPDEFNATTDLVNDLDMDSIKLIQLVVAIETEFDIELTEEEVDLSNLSEFGRLNAIIESKLVDKVT